MTIRAMPVETILEYLLENEQNLKISAYIDVEGVETEIVLMSNLPLYEYLIRHYYGYTYYYPNIQPATSSFLTVWGDFFRRHQNNINRQYLALAAEYNPINNYYMTEHEETDHENGGTVTTETDGTKTQTGTIGDSGSTETTSNIYGYNSGTGANADKVEGTTGNTRTYNVSNGDDTTVTETIDTNSGTDRTLTRSGNIGITLTSSIITGELELRHYDIATEFIKMFAAENLHAIGIVGDE